MQVLKVTNTNAFTGLTAYVTIKGDLGMTIDEYLKISRQFHPNSFINFYWNDDKDFIFAQPLNMANDDKLVNDGLMSFDEYITKWYPEISGECTI